MGKTAQARTLENQLFYDAFKANPIGIAVENLEGQPLFVNPALCTMLGFSEEEMCGKHCGQFSPPEDAGKDWALFQQLRAGLIDHYQLEKRYFRRDGSLVWGRLSVSLLNHRPSPLVIAMVQDITDRKQAEEALAGMNRKLIEAQEQERTRIARELHDNINQRLALLAVEIEVCRQNPPRSAEDMSRLLIQFRERIAEVSSEVQSISHQLHSSQLEYLGIVAATKSFCREFAARQKIEVDFRHDDIPQPVSHGISLCLFRVLQEALHNAFKHSNARHFEVSLGCSANQLRLTVRDPGMGFDMERTTHGAGLGLISMQERVRLVNGTIAIESEPMRGTTIHVHVPFKPERFSP